MKVVQVRARDNEGDIITYSLEQDSFYQEGVTRLPFRIDNRTGAVFLNESIKERVSSFIFIL